MDDHSSGLPLGMPAPREPGGEIAAKREMVTTDLETPETHLPEEVDNQPLHFLDVAELRQAQQPKPSLTSLYWPEAFLGAVMVSEAILASLRLSGWQLSVMLGLLVINCLLLCQPVVSKLPIKRKLDGNLPSTD